jgi:hypothetical protein
VQPDELNAPVDAIGEGAGDALQLAPGRWVLEAG